MGACEDIPRNFYIRNGNVHAHYKHVYLHKRTRIHTLFNTATTHTTGVALEKWFFKHGINLTTIDTAIDPGYSTNTFRFYDTTEHSYPPLEKMKGCGKSTAACDSFISSYLIALGVSAQQICRARFYSLTASLRRELVYVNSIRDMQRLAMQKLLALGVTVGIGGWQSYPTICRRSTSLHCKIKA